MTSVPGSVPGVDHPEEQTEAEVTLTGRGISVSARVEVVQNEFISVRPSVSEFVDQVVVKVGDVVELFWKTDDSQRALPAEITDVEQGAVVRWRMRADRSRRGQPAAQGRPRPGDRAGHCRVRVHRPQGRDHRHQRGGPARGVRGTRCSAGGRRRLDLLVELEDGTFKTKAEVVRTQARGARWVISIRFTGIQEKDQDRIRRRVFQALREERAKRADDAPPDLRG